MADCFFCCSFRIIDKQCCMCWYIDWIIVHGDRERERDGVQKHLCSETKQPPHNLHAIRIHKQFGSIKNTLDPPNGKCIEKCFWSKNGRFTVKEWTISYRTHFHIVRSLSGSHVAINSCTLVNWANGEFYARHLVCLRILYEAVDSSSVVSFRSSIPLKEQKFQIFSNFIYLEYH